MLGLDLQFSEIQVYPDVAAHWKQADPLTNTNPPVIKSRKVFFETEGLDVVI